jgi:hypothetical protein
MLGRERAQWPLLKNIVDCKQRALAPLELGPAMSLGAVLAQNPEGREHGFAELIERG